MTSDREMGELKPCPFCGGEAAIERVGDARQSTIYRCDFCGCSLETGEEWGHGTAWNRRAPDPRIDQLQRERDEVPFQARVQPWMLACFGAAISANVVERNDRFIEEALELAQANGYSADRAHALVDYVFGRPVGEPAQEAGGVMVTLAALCLAAGLDMHQAAEVELARVWTKVEAIRAKQRAKPTGSALPIAVRPTAAEASVQQMSEALKPFADFASQHEFAWFEDEDDETLENSVAGVFTVGQFRAVLRAQAALADSKTGEGA